MEACWSRASRHIERIRWASPFPRFDDGALHGCVPLVTQPQLVALREVQRHILQRRRRATPRHHGWPSWCKGGDGRKSRGGPGPTVRTSAAQPTTGQVMASFYPSRPRLSCAATTGHVAFPTLPSPSPFLQLPSVLVKRVQKLWVANPISILLYSQRLCAIQQSTWRRSGWAMCVWWSFTHAPTHPPCR